MQYSENVKQSSLSAPTAPAPYGGQAEQFPTGVPVQAPHIGNAPQPWSTGLCDCFDDVGNCCLTCWCPCVTFGRIAETVDRGSNSCGASGSMYCLVAYMTGCAWIYSCSYREKMRKLYGLPEDPCADCLVHYFCEPCALCQEHRELQNRGFDMALGWHGNMERQNQGVPMAPMAQGMYR